MPLPEVNQNVQDFGLGQVRPSNAKTHAKIGICSIASPNVVNGWAGPSLKTMVSALGTGPLAESAAYHRQAASAPLFTCAVNPSSPGVVGALTQGVGSSVLSITGTPLDSYSVIVAITRAATDPSVGTAAFKYTLDGGRTWSAEIALSTAGYYAIPGTGMTLTFAAGSLVLADEYSFQCTAPGFTVTDVIAAMRALEADQRTWGWLHVVGIPRPSLTGVTAHPAAVETPPTVTATGTPTAYADYSIKITLGGAVATAKFEFSRDGGGTWVKDTGGVDFVTAAAMAAPVDGLTFHFGTGTYVIGQTFTFNTYGGIGALFSAVDAEMTAMANAFRYAGAILELPDTNDAVLLKATSVLASTEGRVMYVGGYCDLASAMPGPGASVFKRTDAWPLAARLAAGQIHEDLGKVASGPLPGVSALYRDENVTPGFGEGRIATLRTIVGEPGFYAASDRVGDMMSQPGSDFNLSQRRTVMDVALGINRQALLPWLNAELPVNPKTGKIRETSARGIEGKLNADLSGGLLNSPEGAHCSAVKSVIDRSEDIASTNNLSADVALVPFGYAKAITVTVHYATSV